MVIYSVSKKIEYSEMGLFGAFKSLLCLTILNGLTLWVARACLGTTGNIFLSPQCTLQPLQAIQKEQMSLSIQARIYTAGTKKYFL